MKERNSRIELLKIIAIFAICLTHVTQSALLANGLVSGVSSSDITIIVLHILQLLGNIGNIIFISCSCYFLLDSKVTSKKKIINIVADCFAISIIMLIPYIFLNIDVSLFNVVKQFAPITFQTNWFVGAYLLLYVIHPYLNIIIKKITKKQLLRIIVVFFIIYSVVQFLILETLFYSNLIGFIEIYFIVAYVKLYMSDFQKNLSLNIKIAILSFLGSCSLVLVTNFLGFKFNFLSTRVLYWNNLVSPFNIFIGISLLNAFNRKKFNNKFINYISSLSLLFYIIHENYMFRTYIRPLFFNYVSSDVNIIIWVILFTIILFVCSLFLSFLYNKLLQKYVHKIFYKIYDLVKKIYVKFEEKLLKFD